MCGIVGIIGREPVSDRKQLAVMRDTMRHRGPDDAGIWWGCDGRAGLAHRRLSIIDLSSGGHQPMVDPTGQLAIAYNGEIYNYRELRDELAGSGVTFRTSSDTEVLVEAYRRWGTDCLSRLNGMFAFALYDARRRSLFLARDRAGQKPLYYLDDGQRLVFASELKAILADPSVPRRIDLHALSAYLAYGYVPGDMSMFQGIAKLPAGCAMTYQLDTGRRETWPYWQLPQTEGQESASEEELIEQLHDLLRESVRRRLVSDVPVGILLSGGIDSSLVTAMAAEAAAGTIKTFTISFPGHGAYDESQYARMVAEHFGTEHIELAAEAATVDLLPELARQYDEPMADSSMVPTYLVSRLVREHATVALGGDGGDELFGGYPWHSWLQKHDRLRRFLPRPIRALLYSLVTHAMRPGARGRNYLLSCTSGLHRGIAQINIYFDALWRRRLLAPVWSDSAPAGGPEARKMSLCSRGGTPLQLSTAVDFQTYLSEDILVKVDRASMLASLEVRAPFLDPRVIEFAFSRVPDRLRASHHEQKILPRRLAEKLLPPQLDLTRKQGFSLPLQQWFNGPWGSYCCEVLSEADSALFDRRTIDRLIADQRRGYSNTPRLFMLTMFELWRRHYRVDIGDWAG